jgi:putative sterol carrier protein
MAGKCARAISLLADYMNRTSETREFISGWESKIRFELSGEKPFGLVSNGDGSVSFKGEERIENPDVIFYSDSEVFYKLITGREDQDEAFSNGLVEVKGSIFDSVKFRHAAEITQEKHSTLFTTLRALSRFT